MECRASSPVRRQDGGRARTPGAPSYKNSISFPLVHHRQQRLVKTGGRLIKHVRYYWLLLAEGRLHRRLFGQMLRRIWALPAPNE